VEVLLSTPTLFRVQLNNALPIGCLEVTGEIGVLMVSERPNELRLQSETNEVRNHERLKTTSSQPAIHQGRGAPGLDQVEVVMLFNNLSELPLGIRRPLFSRLGNNSWILVGAVRREASGFVLDFQGEFEACRPIWEAVAAQSVLDSDAPDSDDPKVAFGVLWDNGIRPVARGILTKWAARPAETTLRRVRAEQRARMHGGGPRGPGSTFR
jgi:hypothetical protein